MIYFADNFLDEDSYLMIKKILSEGTYEEYMAGDKPFYVQMPIDEINDAIVSKIETLEGGPIRNILSFFRRSTDELDTDWRIHSDQKINGEQPDRAVVLFMSPSKSGFGVNGTAFWKHKEYGHTLPRVENDEFDRILTEDANNISKWELSSVIGHRENRLISYPASYFHSKYPNRSWKEGRDVFVMFYSHGQ
jgi:hypothetical protein